MPVGVAGYTLHGYFRSRRRSCPIYGKRWSIEVFFEACKSMLRLGKEFQTRSYDSLWHTHEHRLPEVHDALLELRRSEDRAYGELFTGAVKSWKDISFIASLALLLMMLKSAVRTGNRHDENHPFERMFTEFVRKTPGFLRNKIGVLAVGVMTTIYGFQGPENVEL